MASFTDRIIGAAMLDVRTYEEVEADKGAMGQAMTLVVLQSVAAGIGAILTGGITGMIIGVVGALLGWFIWAFVIFLVGTKLLPEPQTRSDMGELLRTIGFASAPGLLLFLAIIPILGGLISLAVSIWMLAAMVIAVRQALDYESTALAIGVCLTGWLVLVFASLFLTVIISAALMMA